MKIWFWLLLTMLTLLAGCAEGYYSSGVGYGREFPRWQPYQSESEYEYNMKIWREESGR